MRSNVHGLSPALAQRLEVLSHRIAERGGQIKLDAQQLALVNLGDVRRPSAPPLDDSLACLAGALLGVSRAPNADGLAADRTGVKASGDGYALKQVARVSTSPDGA